MTLPISSLANMEYALYGGGLGAYGNCPSYLNGYRASSNTFPYMNYGNNGNFPNVQQSYQNPYVQAYNPYTYNQQVQQTYPQQTQQVVVNNQDINTLAEYYKKENAFVQKWGDLGTSAAMIAFMENPQNTIHWINSLKSIRPTDAIFNMKDPAIKALWEKNPELMQKAYNSLHAVNRSAQGKVPLVQKWFSKPMDGASRKMLEEMMENALKSGDEKAILKAAETLKAARGMDGYIPTAWNKVKGFFSGKEIKNLTPAERIAKKTADIEKAVNAPAAVKPGMTGLLKQGIKEGKTFAIFGMIIDLPKIISAYKNGGADSALTQTLQTGVRSIADGIGWTIGRAAGTALGTKVGAAIGTAICPGVGTAVGAVIGFLGGAAGSIWASKVTHALMPVDEATKLEAEVNKKTAQGQAQLLQFVLDKANSGEAVPQHVLYSAQNVATRMSA